MEDAGNQDDTAGEHRLELDHLYIFAMDDGHGGKKLMVTPEHAHDDVDMTTTGQSC